MENLLGLSDGVRVRVKGKPRIESFSYYAMKRVPEK
jgi:hypothetical protein